MAQLVVQPAEGDAGARVKLKKAKLWCSKCRTDDHMSKDWTVKHYCYICDKLTHNLARCPVLKVPKPSALLCGHGNDAMAFFQMPDSSVQGEPCPSNVAYDGRYGHRGTLQASVVEAEVPRIVPVQSQWKWKARMELVHFWYLFHPWKICSGWLILRCG